ncbi:MAG: EAL domain-containing protein [Syntrophotaleaceae bacterium]
MKKTNVKDDVFSGFDSWRVFLYAALAAILLLVFLATSPVSFTTIFLVITAVGLFVFFVWNQRALSLRSRQLLESEKRYRLLIEHSISAIAVHEMILDRDGRPEDYVFLSANPAFETHTGLKVVDILGRRVTEVLPGIEKTHTLETYGRVVLTRQSISFEEYSELLGRYFLVHAYPLGELCFATVFTDITESRRAEQEIHRQNSLITSLLDSIPDLIFFKDTQGIYLGCNPQFAEFVGRPKEEIVGKTDFDLFDKELAEFFRENDRRMLELRSHRQNEEWVNYPDGRRVLLDTLKTPYWGPDGELIGIIGVSRDNTARKQAEEALEKRIVALTRPLDDTTGVTFEDLFSVKEIQQLQDDFAHAAGVASIITHPDGTPITAPSNFCRLCKDIICKTAKGRAICWRSNALLGQPSNPGPTIHKCQGALLWEAGSALSVGGRHIANWLVGQVRDVTHDEEQIRTYAREIGADETATVEAFREVPSMSRNQFERVAQALYSVARQLSNSAYQNVQQARFITEQKKSQREISYLAHHDQLTGLANRLLFAERFEQEAKHALRAQKCLAICLLDLDSFKAVNDLHGHQAGDRLLCEVAKRLTDSVRATDLVCRMGGDEFLILFTDLKEADAVKTLVRKVMACFTSAYLLENHVHSVSASMGVAVFPEDGRDLATLFKHADAAMYFAKDSGRNNIQFFHEEISQRVQTRLELERELRKALQDGHLELHYQPIWQMAEKRMVGMEALLRWPHPEKGMISPCRFIPVAEQSNLILLLGEWVLQTACREMADWREKGMPILPVSVNVSARQLFQEDFAIFVRNLLTEHNLSPGNLTLEVTESIFLEKQTTVEEVMNNIKGIGVGLALDDFGTGYSSLSYLSRFRIDKLKIDRSFIEHICRDEQDAILASAIIHMAQNLGMQVIAEGVENADQERFLAEQGCDLAQGFFYCRPKPLAVIQEMFENDRIA